MTVSLYCNVSGIKVSYVWERNSSGWKWSRIMKSNSNRYVVSNIQQSQQYRCISGNDAGTIISKVSTIQVLSKHILSYNYKL